MSWDENTPIVADGGSSSLKAGFAGEEAPRLIFSSVIGRNLARPSDPPLVGDIAIEAAARPNSGLSLSYPLEHGIIEDFDSMTLVWGKMFEELKVDPRLFPVLMTEAPLNPVANREKMAEVMFEKFGVPAVNLQIQAVMSLYTAGRTDGVIIDSGDGVSHVVPVFEGYTVPTAIKRIDLAGRDLTEWMMTLLNDERTDEKSRTFSTTTDREMARCVKEQCCYVALDFEKEYEEAVGSEDEEGKMEKATVNLPDGTKIEVGKARFCCPELFFQPGLAKKDCRAIHDTVHGCVQMCPIDCRRTLYSNLVLSGGSTMFKNFDTRLRNEVMALVPERAKDDVRVIAMPERKYSVWMGAAILASLASFANEWVTKTDYYEIGPKALHSKCQAHGSFVAK